MAVDEWPDQESFQAFMEQAQPDIRPVMEAAGVTSQPSVTVWRTLDTGTPTAGEPAAARSGRLHGHLDREGERLHPPEGYPRSNVRELRPVSEARAEA